MKKVLLILLISHILILSIFSETFTIQESIDIAYKNDPQLKSLEKELESLQIRKLQSLSAFLPEITADCLYLKQGLPASMEAMARQFGPAGAEMGLSDETYSGTLSVTQPLYLGGVRYYAYLISDKNIEMKENEIKLRKKEIKYNVKQAFYNVLIAERYILIYQESLDLAREQLRIAEARYESGEASDFDVLRSQVQISNIRPSLYRAENNLALAKSAFLTQLNLPLETMVDVTGVFSTTPVNKDLQGLINEAFSNRIELKNLETAEEIAELGIKIAKSGYHPSLFFSYGYSEKATEFSTNPDEWSTSWNSSFVISIPIFKGFNTRLKVKEAKKNKETIEPNIDALKNGIRLQIKSAYLNLNNTRRILESSELNIQQAERYVEIVQRSYEEGMMTALDLMNAQFSLTQARIEQIRSRFEYQMNLIELDYALGK